jgi:hypothetical protein
MNKYSSPPIIILNKENGEPLVQFLDCQEAQHSAREQGHRVSVG